MKIIDIRCLRGPNYWSIRHPKLVVMKLDLEELEDFPTNRINGFYERLHTLMPSLYSHECSEGRPGGFFTRVQMGTWMGHVVEHIALEMQTLAGMDVGFGRTRGTGQTGVYHVVFAYAEEQPGMLAAHYAVAMAQALINCQEYDLHEAISTLRQLHAATRLGPSTSAVVKACVDKGVPYLRLDDSAYVQLGYGAAQKRIQATVSSQTCAIAVELAANKNDTKQILSKAGIPVPYGAVVEHERELEALLRDIDFPLVVKPLDGNHGRGVTTDIQNIHDLYDAFVWAKAQADHVIVEQHLPGNDYRLLLVDYKLVAAAWRLPAQVVGDGLSSIQRLIDDVNRDSRRGNGHQNVLTRIEVDQATLDILNARRLSLSSVLPAGKRLFLKKTANLSTGGTAIDVTDDVHPEVAFMAERVARAIGLNICGIDLIAEDIAHPLKTSGATVIEVNAGPGLRMHTHPSEGKPRDVGKAIADSLFPDNSHSVRGTSVPGASTPGTSIPGASTPGESTPGRIPVMAVTGTNGKTTTTRLLAHILKQTGTCVGFTTTEGIYIGDYLIEKGDCTGPGSAEKILLDSSVEAAVFECARGGMLRSGLAFDQCDVGIVTNVAEDHLGLRDIHSIEDMARVKAIVPESVKPDGYAVLNADNDHTYAMRERVQCQVALFSRQPNSERVRAHGKAGGLAAIYEDGSLSIRQGNQLVWHESVDQIPLTFGGQCPFMIENVLAAVLAAYCQGIPAEMIRQGVRTFEPSWETTPGRMNLFDFQDFTILVDYAHNPHGLSALGEFVRQYDTDYRIGILTGVGDRRDEDIFRLGQLAANIFDEIIIRLDMDVRGRNPYALVELVKQGVLHAEPNKPITVIPDELAAIDYAIQNARPGSLIVHLSERIHESVGRVMQHKQAYTTLISAPL